MLKLKGPHISNELSLKSVSIYYKINQRNTFEKKHYFSFLKKTIIFHTYEYIPMYGFHLWDEKWQASFAGFSPLGVLRENTDLPCLKDSLVSGPRGIFLHAPPLSGILLLSRRSFPYSSPLGDHGNTKCLKTSVESIKRKPLKARPGSSSRT